MKMSKTKTRISRTEMLEIIGAPPTGSDKALSARADRIAKANKLTQYRIPGLAGYFYDPAEVRRAAGGTPLPHKI